MGDTFSTQKQSQQILFWNELIVINVYEKDDQIPTRCSYPFSARTES